MYNEFFLLLISYTYNILLNHVHNIDYYIYNKNIII